MSRKRSIYGRIFKRKGRPGYYIRIRQKGNEFVRWAGPDRRTATEYLAEVMRCSSREKLLGERAIAATTFKEFKPTLLAYFRARHADSTYRSDEGRVEVIEAYFDLTLLRDVNRGCITTFLTYLSNVRKCAAGTVNRYTSCLSKAFDLAVELGYAATNPTEGIKRPKEDERPVPYLSDADVRTIIERHPDGRYRALLRVLADVGIRRSVALRLQWRDVELDRAMLLVRRSKSHKAREVPLTGAAIGAFQALRAERGPIPMRKADYVWPEFKDMTEGAVSNRFRKLAADAGYEGLRLHDLRHGFCSRLAQAGVPIPTIAALAGHQSIRTTMRYACHLPEGATVEAIRRLDESSRQKRSGG